MSANAFMFNSCYNLPERDIGFVIGTKGNKLQANQRETGASIKLVKAPAGSGMQPYFHITSFSMDTVNAAWAKLHEVATLAMQLNTGAIERKNQERFPEFFLRVEPIFCGGRSVFAWQIDDYIGEAASTGPGGSPEEGGGERPKILGGY